jgi:hypothetical protein
LPPLQPHAAPKPADAARVAAQKAFFEIAASKPAAAAAPVQASAAPAARRAMTAPASAPAAGSASPARPLRPGSILDIRV